MQQTKEKNTPAAKSWWETSSGTCNLNMPYFDVRLLISPVVVSNCCANAKIPAIPKKIDLRLSFYIEPILLTNARIKVWNNCSKCNNDEMYNLSGIWPLPVELSRRKTYALESVGTYILRVLRVIWRLWPQYLRSISRQLKSGCNFFAKLYLCFSVRQTLKLWSMTIIGQEVAWPRTLGQWPSFQPSLHSN